MQGSILILIYNAARDHITTQSGEVLVETSRNFHRWLDDTASRLTDSSVILAADFGFRSAIASADIPTIRSALQNASNRIDANSMMLIDLDGRIACDPFARSAEGKAFPFRSMLREATIGEQASSIVVLRERILQFVVVPIQAPDLIGWIGVGVEVDDTEAARLKAHSTLPIELTFAYSSDQRSWRTSATTVALEWAPSLAKMFTDIGAHHARGNAVGPLSNVPIGGDSFTTLVEIVDTPSESPAVGVALQHSLSAALAPHRPLFVLLIIVAIIGFLVTAMVALLIARGVTRPIRNLDLVAKQMRAGNYPEPVAVKGADEISHFGRTFNDMVKEISQRQRRIEYQAAYDGITDLPNRKRFERLLSEAIEDAASTPRLAIFLISLENFFEINNTLGHEAGDRLIADAAKRLRNCLKKGDLLSRFGHEKFAVLVEFKGDAMVELIAGRINLAFEAPFAVANVNVDVTVAIGVAYFPEHGTDHRTLLRRVEIAIESAHTSIQGYEIYDSDNDPYTAERLSLMSDLRQGMDSDELVLHYQPKVDLPGETVSQVEALVRWHHPKHGNVPPDSFIGIAERTGHIRKLTRWVLKQAIADCSEWHRLGQPLSVCVNVSAADLIDPALPSFIMQELVAHDLGTHAIILEVTESAVMERPQLAIELLRRLAAMGLHIAIDDFGTGHSSMTYVQLLPATELKIDRSFITDVVCNRNDEIIVRSTIELAHNLGMKVTAEGVEDADTVRLLTTLKCDFAQGWHYTKALPADELIEFVRHRNGDGLEKSACKVRSIR